MILRSVMKHVHDQNWFAVFLDFVIVVVGVFIGIQVANWNEARREDSAGRAYLDRIREDLAVDRSTLGRSSKTPRGKRSSCCTTPPRSGGSHCTSRPIAK